MKKLLLALTLTYSIAHAAQTIIPLTSGYDLTIGGADYSTTNLNLSPVNLAGYMFESNVTGYVYWTVPRQFFVSSLTNRPITNMVVGLNVLTTNPVTYALYFRLLLYTNIPSSNSFTAGSPTNRVTPYYDSGDLIAAGVGQGGTNIAYISYTNTISNTNLFSYNTNIAFGIVKVTQNIVAGNYGSVWFLGGRFQTR